MTDTIIIIGGLSAGPSAAAKARRTNEVCNIILFEKTKYISYATCGIPYSLSGAISNRDKLMVVKAALLRKRFNIDVRLEEEVLDIRPGNREVVTNKGTYTYTKLIFATGSSPFMPQIDNLHKATNWSHCRTIEDFDKMIDDGVVQKHIHIAVLGAGLIGIEVSENLRESCKHVHLIELAPQILPPWDSKFADLAESELKNNGVHVYTGTTIEKLWLKDDKIHEIELSNGEVIAIDYLIIGLGGKPNTQMLTSLGADHLPNGALLVNEFMETSLPDIYAAGDCASIKNLITHVHDYFPMGTHSNKGGRTAGANAAGGNETFAGAYKTAIVKVFEYTLGRTGMNPRALKAAGIPFEATLVVVNASAGFYLDPKDLVLEIYYHKETGVILGAEAFGEKGVDKRIDVLSTAIYAKLTIEDLPNLDLAYAPPYSPAKDAVIIAGYASGNKGRRKLSEVSGKELRYKLESQSNEIVLIDVRSQFEVKEEGIIASAIHIELDELRNRLDEIDKNKAIVTYCAKGLRGYLAATILSNHGFDNISNLGGGFKTWVKMGYPVESKVLVNGHF